MMKKSCYQRQPDQKYVAIQAVYLKYSFQHLCKTEWKYKYVDVNNI